MKMLEVSEEAGLFFRVAGRVFVQYDGHTACCWTRSENSKKLSPDHHEDRERAREHTRGTEGPPSYCCCCCCCCSSAPDVHHDHFTSSAAATTSLSPAAAAVIYVAVDLWRTRTPRAAPRTRMRRRWRRRRRHHSPVGGARLVSCRPADVVSQSGGGGGNGRKNDYARRPFVSDADFISFSQRNEHTTHIHGTQNGDTYRDAVRVSE